MANEEHLQLLKQGVEAWNQWRRENRAIHPNLGLVDLSEADLRGADLSWAVLGGAYLSGADLTDANVSQARLDGATLLQTNFQGANLTGCAIYGISAWDVNLVGAQQADLVITPLGEPKITVDNLAVAQFIYLLLRNEKIRDIINTIGKKGVLILGRFTERKDVLEAIRAEVRRRDYVPIVFDFERPTDRDFTETVMTLAGMCLFIVADITQPKSVPLELQATVPNYMIPFVPIIQEGEKPFAMFVDLWHKYRDWVVDPFSYRSVVELTDIFDQAVVEPALRKRKDLEVKKAQELIIRRAEDL
jgi:Pentapeptide repeats (8 copies)